MGFFQRRMEKQLRDFQTKRRALAAEQLGATIQAVEELRRLTNEHRERVIEAMQQGRQLSYSEGSAYGFEVKSEVVPVGGMVQLVQRSGRDGMETVRGEWHYRLTREGFVTLTDCLDF